MGLETATFIHQLDPSNPIGGSDPKSQGDDHIRLTKETLQNTFPNIEGAVNASHTELNVLEGITATTEELNYTDGVTSNIQTQLDAKAANSSFENGIHTPAATAISNCTISSPIQHRYSRVGNIVTVSGAVAVSVTSGGAALTRFSVALPVARTAGNFTTTAQGHGAGSNNTSSGAPVFITSLVGQQRMEVNFYSTASGAQTVFYTYQYNLTNA